MLIMVKTAAVITRSVLGEIPSNVNIVLMMLWNRLVANSRSLVGTKLRSNGKVFSSTDVSLTSRANSRSAVAVKA